MVKQGTRDDEVGGSFFYYILKDIDSANLETWQLLIHDTTEIDVTHYYVTRIFIRGTGQGLGLAMIHKFFVALGIRLLPQDCLDSPRCRKILSRLVCQ
jgi:hypothetical protein